MVNHNKQKNKKSLKDDINNQNNKQNGKNNSNYNSFIESTNIKNSDYFNIKGTIDGKEFSMNLPDATIPKDDAEKDILSLVLTITDQYGRKSEKLFIYNDSHRPFIAKIDCKSLSITNVLF